VLDADNQTYVLPLPGDLGYAETALTEPWACVEAAYTQRRRLYPKPGGSIWLVGHPGDTTAYQFSAGLEAPATIVATDVPSSLLELLRQEAARREVDLIIRDHLIPADYPVLKAELTAEGRFRRHRCPARACRRRGGASNDCPPGYFQSGGSDPLDGAKFS
jgi:hypothetical protein